MASDFAAWLTAEVEHRGWSLRELGRRSGLSGAFVSDLAGGRQDPGLRSCVQIAAALDLLPETVLRRAGLLPALPPAVEQEQEAVAMLRQLPPDSLQAVLAQLRVMTGNLRGAADRTEVETAPEADEALEEQLLEEFRHLPEEWQKEALKEMERLQHFAQMRPRIIGGEDEG